MNATEYLILIAGMGLVTYVPRWAPLFFLARRQLPKWLVDWLDLIPMAILSALVAPLIFTSGDPRQLDLLQPASVVAVPTLLIALWTRSMGGAVLAGMGMFWLVSKYW